MTATAQNHQEQSASGLIKAAKNPAFKVETKDLKAAKKLQNSRQKFRALF